MLKMIVAAMMAVLSVSAFGQTPAGRQTVRGYVKDSLTLSPLPGATVVISQGSFATTDDSGYFEISGGGQAEIRFLGYKTKNQRLDPSPNVIAILLQEDVILTDEVIVTATRATDKTGATFSTISKQALQKQNFGQDLPLVLNWTPSLVTTSDAGAGVGYTGLRIRGSDATRINVTINGIPYNDSESQGSFWVDIPDIATSTQSIQVQRGVGTSTNGAGAFGASINVQTNVKNDKPYADVINSFGSFNTHRHTVGFGTGLINKQFVFDGRLSMIKSDGYIDRASSNLKSYYLSGGYYGDKTMLKAIAFGGQEITYQSWNGVPESRLKGDPEGMLVTAEDMGFNDEQTDNLLNSDSRTFNMFLYPNQVDNYKQDHYQLHFSHRFNPHTTLNAALHYTYGRGYYEEYRYDDKFANYGLSALNGSSDIVRQRWLDNNFYGSTFSLNYEKGDLNMIAGGGINRYDGDHFGKIVWSSVNAGIPINYQYYFNNGLKDDYNFFYKTTYQMLPDISLFVDLQYRGISYKTSGIENKQYSFDISKRFNFFNPKFGWTWTVSPQQSVYASLSGATREPVRDDFVDASRLQNATPKEENLRDLEVGWRYRKDGYSLSANYYLMSYKNQLVLTGALNDVGASLRTNVDKSYRTGIELEASSRLSREFSVGANLTLSRNKIKEFKEVIYDYGEDFDEYNVIENNYSNTDISFSPSVIAGGIFSYNIFDWMELSLLTKYVGKQYLDNTSNNNRKLDPYFTADVRIVYTYGIASFSLLINNILNEKYESNGYTYGYLLGPTEVRQNYYYPQAGTNVMAMLALRFR